VTGEVRKQPVTVLIYVIVDEPTLTPVTSPEPSTVAFPLLLLHTPLIAVSDKVIVEPIHTEIAPEINAIFGLTVTTATEIQPGPALYVIVAVPAAPPVTIPVVLPTVATTE
jgi:hypothetical protein